MPATKQRPIYRSSNDFPEPDELAAHASLNPEPDELYARASPNPEPDELAARVSLKAQIGRLEREHAAILAGAFPHLPCDVEPGQLAAVRRARLQSLGELERQRDELVLRVRSLSDQAQERQAFERRAQERLAQMRAEPARHKFRRLAVRDLGEGSCGTWQVRPRLGLIGMLAGWWEVKLSSGCP